MFFHLRIVFDDSLAITFKEMKKAHMMLSAFWNIHGPEASLIVSEADITKLRNCDGDFISCEPELDRVCQTRIGRAMFQWANAKVAKQKVSLIMNDLSTKFDEVEDLTVDFAVKKCTEARQAIANIPNLALLDSKRRVAIPYRGRQSWRDVASTEDEIQLRQSAAAKGRAAQKPIPEVSFEKELVDGFQLKHVKVAPELIKGAHEARLAANNFIHLESDDADGQLSSKVLEVKAKTLSTIPVHLLVEDRVLDS